MGRCDSEQRRTGKCEKGCVTTCKILNGIVTGTRGVMHPSEGAGVVRPEMENSSARGRRAEGGKFKGKPSVDEHGNEFQNVDVQHLVRKGAKPRSKQTNRQIINMTS